MIIKSFIILPLLLIIFLLKKIAIIHLFISYLSICLFIHLNIYLSLLTKSIAKAIFQHKQISVYIMIYMYRNIYYMYFNFYIYLLIFRFTYLRFHSFIYLSIFLFIMYLVTIYQSFGQRVLCAPQIIIIYLSIHYISNIYLLIYLSSQSVIQPSCLQNICISLSICFFICLYVNLSIIIYLSIYYISNIYLFIYLSSQSVYS